MPLLSRAYGLSLDDLARAAYGVLFEEVPEGSDDTADLEISVPADTMSGTNGAEMGNHRTALSRIPANA